MQWLQRRGFEAYLVGGCVRDLLLGLLPKDFDIATSARPAQVKRVFPRNCRIIGRRFKLAHLHFHHNSKILECSTFRRTPSEDRTGDDLLITQDNEFGSAEEDALRRDFPINALFFDPMQDRILDWTGGLEDLRAGVIRTIGDPVVRFREDPIRILRAAKFAGRLGFQIDPASLDAMAQTAPDLVRAAPPRVLEEILRLLRCGNALDCFQVLRDIGAIKVLLPIVGDFLSNAGEAERVVFWHLLDALDGKVRSGRVPSNPVLLGTLFARPVAEACAREPDRAPATIAERLLGPFANTLRLPRRDSGCLKRICGVLGRFRSQSNRRFKTTAFLRDPYFYEALDLFELHCIATGEGAEELEQWRRLSDESSGEVPEGFQDDSDDSGDGGDGSDSEPASEPEDEPRPQLREPNDDPEAALSAPQPDPEHAWDEPARTQAQPSLESESDLRGGRRRRRGRRGRRDDTMARGDSRTPLSGDGDSAEAREDGRELGTGPETRPAGDPHLEETDEREGDREGRTSTQSATQGATQSATQGASQGATQGAGEGRATREVAEPEDEDHDATEPAPTASDLLIPESEFRKLSRSARRRRLRKLRRMRQEGGDARPESGRSESSRPAFAGESSDSGRREEPTPELPAADEQAHDLRGAESPGDLGSGDLSSGDLRSGDVSSLEDAGGRRKRRRRRRGRRGDGERADIEPGTEELTPQPPSSESEVPEPSEEEIAKAAAPTEFSDEPEPLTPLEDVGDIEVPPFEEPQFEEPPSEPDPQRGQHGRHPRQKQAHARGRGGDRGRDPRSIHPREQHPREQHPREQHPREQHPREQRSRDQRARDQGQRREGHPRQQPQGPQNPQNPQQPQRPGGQPARREDKKHGSRRDRNRDRGKPDGRHPGKPPHDRRGGKVEVLEPESVDLTAFEVELDPTRAPTFGAGVESQQRKKSPIRKILLEEDKEPYKPPPPPDLDPNAAPPAPTEGPESGGGDTFGDW